MSIERMLLQDNKFNDLISVKSSDWQKATNFGFPTLCLRIFEKFLKRRNTVSVKLITYFSPCLQQHK